MKPIAYDLTPQGFRIPLYDTKRHGDGPDKLVMDSCALLAADHTGKTHTWKFQRKIINRGLDLIGDFREFLKAQDMNPNLTVHQHGLLSDTIQYITTGHRSMTLDTRAQCIAMELATRNPTLYKPSRSARPLYVAYTLPNEDYMYHWIKHRRGFTDMVCTLNVIFGSIKNHAF